MNRETADQPEVRCGAAELVAGDVRPAADAGADDCAVPADTVDTVDTADTADAASAEAEAAADADETLAAKTATMRFPERLHTQDVAAARPAQGSCSLVAQLRQA